MVEKEDGPVKAELPPDRPLGLAGVEPGQIAGSAFWSARPQLPGQFLDGRFVVGNAVEIGKSDAALSQAKAKGPHRQPRIVFDSCEALFGCGRDKLAVLEQTAG